MSQRNTLIIALVLVLNISQGQSIFTVSGYVLEKTSGEGMEYVHIYDTASKSASHTNVHGFFSIKLPEGHSFLTMSYAGNTIYSSPFDVYKDTLVTIYSSPLLLEEITIVEPPLQIVSTGNLHLDPAKIKSMPVLAGEPDVMKTLSIFPGISQGVEGNAGLFVRGGTPDQNLLLLDDVHLYNPNHLFGFLSVFNADALKDINVYKGGFPARYDGRLSSVLDLTTREGNNQELKGTIGVGLINSKLLLEGPLTKGKSSFMLAARTAYLDLLTLPVRIAFNKGNIDQMINYSMFDINSKLNFNMLRNGRLSVSFYKGSDNYQVVEDSNDLSELNLKWGNTTAAINFQKPLSASVYSKHTIYTSNYRYRFLTSSKNLEDPEVYYKSLSRVNDFAAHSFYDWKVNNNWSFNWGGKVIYHKFIPVKYTASWNAYEIESKLNGLEWSVFAESQWVNDKWDLQLGIVQSGYYNQKNWQKAFDPRIMTGYNLGKHTKLNASYSGMHQFLHLLGNSASGLSNDIWVPATNNLPGSYSRQWNIGVNHNNKTVEYNFEIFYKKMENLVEYKNSNNLMLNVDSNWETLLISNGLGKSFGAEFFLKKSFENHDHSLSYTFNNNFRKYSTINFNKWFPARYNKIHEISITGNVTLNDNWNFNYLWNFSTGVPYTSPVAIVDNHEGGTEPLYLYRNNARVPSYHRLDLGFSRVRLKKGRKRTLNLGVYNAYNRRNPFYIDYRYYSEDPNSPHISKTTAFPFMPYIHYSIDF